MLHAHEGIVNIALCHPHKTSFKMDARWQLTSSMHMTSSTSWIRDRLPLSSNCWRRWSIPWIALQWKSKRFTPQTAAAMDRARTSLARGEGIPHEDIRREFGLEK